MWFQEWIFINELSKEGICFKGLGYLDLVGLLEKRCFFAGITSRRRSILLLSSTLEVGLYECSIFLVISFIGGSSRKVFIKSSSVKGYPGKDMKGKANLVLWKMFYNGFLSLKSF